MKGGQSLRDSNSFVADTRRVTGARVTVAILVLSAVVAAWPVLRRPMTAEDGVSAMAQPSVPAVPATIRWMPERLVEGTLFTVIVEGGEPEVQAVVGSFAGEPLHFGRGDDGAFRALAAAPLDSVGVYVLKTEVMHADGSRDSGAIELVIHGGEYRMERLSVAPQFGTPQPPEIQRRIADEASRARAVSVRSHETPRLWEPPFFAPRESRITSGFGHGREFNGQVQSRHTGTDFAGAIGAPIRAPARGVVALVDDFYLGGGVIYIDHGAGLVTGYLHLSAKQVAAGDTVAAGQVIGRVGATGRVTGPHLHWIVRYGGHTVDGTTLLNAPF
jgi:hypothetical protein